MPRIKHDANHEGREPVRLHDARVDTCIVLDTVLDTCIVATRGILVEQMANHKLPQMLNHHQAEAVVRSRGQPDCLSAMSSGRLLDI